MSNGRNKVISNCLFNCFSKCDFSEASLDLFIDDGPDAEFIGLQNYISEITPDSTVNSYLNLRPGCNNISKHKIKEEMRGRRGQNSLRD